MRRPTAPSSVRSSSHAALIAAAAFALGACSAATHRASSTPEYAASESASARELTADQQVLHVLNRLAFGPRPGDVQKVRTMGVDRWIDQQLHPERIRDTASDNLAARFPTLRKSSSELLQEFIPPALSAARANARQDDRAAGMSDSAAKASRDEQVRRQRQQANARAYRVIGELQSARVARAVGSERQLQEVMVDFWENHFNLFAGKGQTRYYLADFESNAIRPHALGKFRDMLGAVAKSPAMLFYLDNAQSVADSNHTTLANAQRNLANRGNRGARGAGVSARRPGAGSRARPARQMPDTSALTADQRRRLAALPPDVRDRLLRATPEQRQSIIAQLAQRQRARGLNENYARELMELHTLGVDGGYSQQDIINVARALTGWTINQPAQGGGFIFRPAQHDADEKLVLGHRLPAGRGIEDGEEVLDIVARHPATARFIATKLARRFVSDSPPPALIDRAAATFLRTDGDIREVVRTIVSSPEFFAQSSYRSKVKSPFELVTSAMRALNAETDTTPRSALLVARLGQPIFGHQAPNGYPETGDAWMNTGAILNRINFGLALASDRVPGVRLARWPQTAQLASLDRAAQVDGVIAALLGGGVSPDTRSILLTGTNPMLSSPSAAAHTAMADSAQDMTSSSDMMTGADRRRGGQRRAGQGGVDRDRPLPIAQTAAAREAVRPGAGSTLGRSIGQLPNLNGFAQIVGLALGSPEFQRR